MLSEKSLALQAHWLPVVGWGRAIDSQGALEGTFRGDRNIPFSWLRWKVMNLLYLCQNLLNCTLKMGVYYSI